MAISAGSVSKDRTYRSDAIKSLFESARALIDSTITFKQGDLLYLDTSAHLIKRVAATGDAATFLGIAPVAVTSGVLVGPYPSGVGTVAAAGIQDCQGPEYGGVFSMILKTGDAFNPGDKVYLVNGGDSQTVTVTDPSDGNYIGLYAGPAIASAAAGQEGQIKIGLRYPGATGAALQF